MSVRITGGRLGRRRVRVPGAEVRPTQDRVRAAVFSSLGERVLGARVLDLFAGSGALGLEAWSRGAAAVWWVECHRRVLAVLRENVRSLCGGEGPGTVPEARVVPSDVLAFLRRAPEGPAFDLVFADPPYDRDGAWFKKILCALAENPILSASGLLIVELAAQGADVPLAGWTLLKARDYGGTRVCTLARTGNPGL